MRTTVEIKDEQRAKLLEIAARRGEKGFSRIVAEALELYLEAEERRETTRKAALLARGVLRDEEAAELRDRARAIREEWR